MSEKGEVDYNMKNDAGQKISRESAEHLAEFRVRCPTCEKVFCKECNETPYHIGFTCDSFKERKEALKCRFCLDNLRQPNENGGDAFINVCHKNECQGYMETSCDKMLDCGHFCYGCKADEVCLPCLHPDCVALNEEKTFGLKDDDYCPICYSAGLGQMPSIQFGCRHIVHEECFMKVL